MEPLHDYVIVGSGAGGCAAAYALARGGADVVLLERGPRLPEDGSTCDPAIVLREGRYKSREAWADRNGNLFAPEECFNLGGKTRWYGAALARFGADEFGGDAARGFLPWPISAAELEPYYDQAEALLELRRFPAEPDLERIASRLAGNGAGWKRAPLSLGLAGGILDRPELAVRFDGFALPGGLKADAPSRLLDRLAPAARLRVHTDTDVVALVPADGDRTRIAGVLCADGRTFRARRVLLAAGALHSPRLLQHYFSTTGLESALPAARNVGRHYKRHVLSAVLAFAPRRQRDLLRKTELLLNDRFPHSSVQPLGGWIDREIVRLTLPRFLPRTVVDACAERVYGFFLQTEDGSHADNRVTARAGAAPLLDYDGARTPHAETEHRALVRAFRGSLWRHGRAAFAQRIGLAGSAHSVGTLVAGRDPATSVVDADGAVHGCANLYVVDGSVLPRIGRLNPALTIYAWSLRVADRLSRTAP